MLDLLISSTCYDLGDLRFEQKDYLTRHGMIVRLSEDWDSAFEAKYDRSSVATCLANVEATNVVVLLLDRRYGPIMSTDEAPPGYAGMSATEAEVECAKKLGRPIITFVRNAAFSDYKMYAARDATLPIDKRLEGMRHCRGDRMPQQTEKLMKLIDDRIRLADDKRNWFDYFDTSVDLRPKLLRRLEQAMPEEARLSLLSKIGIPRLIVRQLDSHTSGNNVSFNILNVGPGAAMDVTLRMNSVDNETQRQHCKSTTVGGLPEGQELLDQPYFASIALHRPLEIVCQYRSASGYKCRLEAKYEHTRGAWRLTTERVQVELARDYVHTLHDFNHEAT